VQVAMYGCQIEAHCLSPVLGLLKFHVLA